MAILRKIQTSAMALPALALFLAQGCGSAYSPLASAGQQPTGGCSESGGMIDTMEEGDFFTGLCTTWAYFIADAAGTSSITARFEPGSDLPGGTSGTSLRFFGTAYNNSWQDFVNIKVPFPESGFNIDANAPTGKVVFSYKVGTTGVGKAHSVGFSHPDTCDPPSWAFYGFSFTPSDTQWREQTVYLPLKNGGVGEFRKGWGCGAPNTDWNSTVKELVTSLNFSIPSVPAGGSLQYDLYLDDIRFE